MFFFTINLDKDIERMANIAKQLKCLNVTYERVPAIYGKGLSIQERGSVFNAFRWWCAMGRPIALAEIGCALSHFSIYQRMIDENIPMACILEDDIDISPKFKECVARIEVSLDITKPQVVLLSDHTQMYGDVNLGDDFELRQSTSGMCTDSYCLTQEAARVLLKQNLPIITPCDTWGRWVCQKKIALFHMLPSVCKQNQAQFGSSTSEGRMDTEKFSHFKRIMYKAKRVVGKAIDILLQKVLGR